MGRSNAGLEPVVQESAPLRRKIAARLRDAVHSGALAPGARLIEKELCETLNVSRTSLREALRELESEGLLEGGVRGLVVARISEEEARNIYAVRAALEGLVAEQFARAAEASDLAAIRAAQARLERAYADNDFASILSEKEIFYEALCMGAKNPVALDLLRRLNSRINRLRALSRSNRARGVDSLREIAAIVDALEKRDATAAKSAAIRHVERAAEAALPGL